MAWLRMPRASLANLHVAPIRCRVAYQNLIPRPTVRHLSTTLPPRKLPRGFHVLGQETLDPETQEGKPAADEKFAGWLSVYEQAIKNMVHFHQTTVEGVILEMNEEQDYALIGIGSRMSVRYPLQALRDEYYSIGSSKLELGETIFFKTSDVKGLKGLKKGCFLEQDQMLIQVRGLQQTLRREKEYAFFEKMRREKQYVMGRIMAQMRGGFAVAIGGHLAFMPNSQTSGAVRIAYPDSLGLNKVMQALGGDRIGEVRDRMQQKITRSRNVFLKYFRRRHSRSPLEDQKAYREAMLPFEYDQEPFQTQPSMALMNFVPLGTPGSIPTLSSLSSLSSLQSLKASLPGGATPGDDAPGTPSSLPMPPPMPSPDLPPIRPPASLGLERPPLYQFVRRRLKGGEELIGMQLPVAIVNINRERGNLVVSATAPLYEVTMTPEVLDKLLARRANDRPERGGFEWSSRRGQDSLRPRGTSRTANSAPDRPRDRPDPPFPT